MSDALRRKGRWRSDSFQFGREKRLPGVPPEPLALECLVSDIKLPLQTVMRSV